MHDLIIRGGTIIDGTGGARRTADIAIDGDTITEIGRITSTARRVLNSDGLLVTPGFVDIHTHYDGQATWDDALYPSFDNGVTTAIVGNCGVGFAPVKYDHREKLMEIMDGVEEIPGSALAVGLNWDWESFPDYLDALDRTAHSFNIGALAAHGPLRLFCMGGRLGAQEPAPESSLMQMCELLDLSMQAGAWGLSSSRTAVHTSSRGEMTPDFGAGSNELMRLATVVGEYGGIFQFAPTGVVGEDLPGLRRDMELFDKIVSTTDAVVHLLVSQTLTYPDFWKEQIATINRLGHDGQRMFAQINARGIGVMLGLANTNPFQTRPTYQAVTTLPRSDWFTEFRKPQVRAKILGEEDNWPDRIAMVGELLGAAYLYAGPEDYEPGPTRKVSVIAEQEGRSMQEVTYDWMAQGGFVIAPTLNYAGGNLDAIRTMMESPSSIIAASDAGAHSLTICDGALPTFVMTHWGRDRADGRFPLEDLVAMLTRKPAQSINLKNRGILAVGMKADVNVIDFDNLRVKPLQVANDLPTGASRLLQGSSGFRATIVNGVLNRENDADTGERPGQLLRRGRI